MKNDDPVIGLIFKHDGPQIVTHRAFPVHTDIRYSLLKNPECVVRQFGKHKLIFTLIVKITDDILIVRVPHPVNFHRVLPHP